MRRLLLALLLCSACNPAAGHADDGLALARAGDLEGAGAAFEAALQEDPLERKALYNLGLLRGLQGRHQEAEALFARFLELAPADALGHLERGRSLAAAGRGDEALDALRLAVASGLDDAAAFAAPEFRELRGEVLFVMLEATVAQRSGVPARQVAAGAEPPPRIRPPLSDDAACVGGGLTLEPAD